MTSYRTHLDTHGFVATFATLLILALSSPAWVQAQLNHGVLQLGSTCEGTSNLLTLRAIDNGGREDLVGFDIYRNTIGDCSAPVRITATPIPRQIGSDLVHEIIDGAIEESIMYHYRLVGVGQERNELRSMSPAFLGIDGVFNAYSSCGLAPIALGFLEDGGWNYSFTACEGTCFQPGAIWVDIQASNPTVDLVPFVGLGLPVMLYGWIGCGTIEGCFIAVEALHEQDCTVDVESMPWSTIKTIYR